MGRKKTLVVKKTVSEADINRRIKEEKNRARIIPRLILIKLLYSGMSVIEASKDVGVVKRVGYQWLKRWNESGFDGLIPRFAGGKPSKLSAEQKKELRTLLEAKDLWYLGDIVKLIKSGFGVEYSERQVRRILKGFKMKHAKPYQIDYRKPKDAEEILKKTRSDKSG
ncbi:MAG: helix-turn-helix domain-containing protein [Thermoplasmatales archaeon]|nr:helix-turn-helix domain-containing protein [Thermoplasmatales archaeon]